MEDGRSSRRSSAKDWDCGGVIIDSGRSLRCASVSCGGGGELKSGIIAEMVDVTADAMADVMDEFANGMDDDDIFASFSSLRLQSVPVVATVVVDAVAVAVVVAVFDAGSDENDFDDVDGEVVDEDEEEEIVTEC